MHTYATNSPFQPRLIAWLAFLATAITIVIGWLTSWIRGRWGFEIGSVSSMAVFSVLYFGFDRWVWRVPAARAILLVPNLNGGWKCSGKTTLREGASVSDEWSAEVCILQSWSRISVLVKTDKSRSRSIAASLYHQPGEGYRLVYHFENVPDADQPALHRHSGACDLIFSEDLTRAEGSYVTDWSSDDRDNDTYEARESIMSRLQLLEARRMDPLVFNAKMANEVYLGIQQSESVRYAVGAMQPIDPEYTKNTFAQGNRVRDQLKDRLCQSCDYRYQGSTTNDTHIKARSDIDLLVILDRFEWLEPPQVAGSPYAGNPKSDMRDLRRNSEEAIQQAFPAVEVDDSGAKSITLEGGSLTRRVDVVPASWYNTNEYSRTGEEMYRGVKVFDSNAEIFVPNLPFLHNHRVELKDRRTLGGMRKAARLMKSLKYDSETVEMSSYDLVGIAYNMSDQMLIFPPPYELRIVESCRSYCVQLRDDPILRAGIVVPNNTRRVFDATEGANIKHLDQMIKELDELTHDILHENTRSFVQLSEARVDHPSQLQHSLIYGARP